MKSNEQTQIQVGILHGAGYVGRELIKLIVNHPRLCLQLVSSSSYAGKTLTAAHPGLRGIIPTRLESMRFRESVAPDSPAEKGSSADGMSWAGDDVPEVLISCARHGSGASEVNLLLKLGFSGLIIDMSADLRFKKPEFFEQRFGRSHPTPHLLDEAHYGLPEIKRAQAGMKLVANPGCFATGISLALFPLNKLSPINNLITEGAVGITALTGASGSGAAPGPSTHFPDRDGNVRSYKVLEHDHQAEVMECLAGSFDVSFVPVSGPFSRGIWGTIHITLGKEYSSHEISSVFSQAYETSPFIRLLESELPELHHSVETPFCDIGWVLKGRKLVVGFAMDNLLKGAASQAIQNLNLCLGMDERLGLLSKSLWTNVESSSQNPEEYNLEKSQDVPSGKTSKEIRQLEDEFEIPTYNRWPLSLEKGAGCYVTDSEGNTYLDFYGGHCVTLLGHNHPEIVAAIKKQADRLLFYSNVVYSGVRAEAASLLVEMAGENTAQVFFCNSGSEANETALKIARKMSGRQTVVAMENGFHGRTMGSLAATWNPAFRGPYEKSLAETVFVAFNDIAAIRGAFQSTPEIAAVILEPIQSMGGVIPIDPEYAQEVRALCDENGAQLIFDEVQTGVGRTGTFLYSEHLGIKPDLTTLAKSLASGVPVGAVLMSEAVSSSVLPGDQGTTFGGGMLAMAALTATLSSLEKENGYAAATQIFDQIKSGLAGESIEVCGAGCLIGLRFNEPVASLCLVLRARGILVGTSSDPNVMRLMPPVIATKTETDLFVDVLKNQISKLNHHYEKSAELV